MSTGLHSGCRADQSPANVPGVIVAFLEPEAPLRTPMTRRGTRRPVVDPTVLSRTAQPVQVHSCNPAPHPLDLATGTLPSFAGSFPRDREDRVLGIS